MLVLLQAVLGEDRKVEKSGWWRFFVLGEVGVAFPIRIQKGRRVGSELVLHLSPS